MNAQYERYGNEWQAEVMKNTKLAITGMLRNVAKERDALNAEHKHRFVTCTWCGWRLDYEADDVEAARATANEHALNCKADPRTTELETLRIELQATAKYKLLDGSYCWCDKAMYELKPEYGHTASCHAHRAALKAGQA